MPNDQTPQAAAALVDAAMAALAARPPARPLAVAYSGGADSSVLLHACAARWSGEVQAVHVHHGLQEAAQAFEAHCRAQCDALGVPLHVIRVDARHAPGDSPEAAARQARYAALAALVRQQPDIQTVALAHHADDQLETLLLALSRGAGVPGLAAMPAQAVRGGTAYLRPLLGVPAAALRAWLRLRGLPWIDDPHNDDARYTRNRIRTHIVPAIDAVFPGFRQTASRSAAHCAQAAELLADLAALDLQTLGQPPRIAGLQALSGARQANALRHWLAQAHGAIPSAAQLDALLVQLAACRTRGHRIHLKIGCGFVQRAGEVLHWTSSADHPPEQLG